MESQQTRRPWLTFVGMLLIASAVVWHSIADRVLPESPPHDFQSHGVYQMAPGTAFQQQGIFVLDTRDGRSWFRSPEMLVKLGGLEGGASSWAEMYGKVSPQQPEITMIPVKVTQQAKTEHPTSP